MAVAATIVWEVRTTGNDNNGGGFNSSASGTDRSQQDAAYKNGTNLTVHASTNTDVLPDGHTPEAADVGNIIQITAGTGWTTGWYEIKSIQSGYWRLDRSPAAVGVAGGTWYMGGALATWGQLGNVLGNANSGIAGQRAWIKSGTYTLTGNTVNTSGCQIELPANKALVISGYETTRGDTGAMPVLNAGNQTNITLLKSNGNYSTKRQLIKRLKVDGNSKTGTIGFGIGASAGYAQNIFYQCEAVNCTTYGFGDPTSPGNINCHQCKASACNVGFYAGDLTHCTADSNTVIGISGTVNATLSFCISKNNIGDGFNPNGSQSNYQHFWNNCIAYNNGGDGFDWGNYGMNRAVDCVAVGNGGYGFHKNPTADMDPVLLRCAAYGNTLGDYDGSGEVIDWLTLTSNPFVDAANDDFNLTTTGGGAVLRESSVTLPV